MILSKAVKKYLNTLGWPGLLTVVKARTLKRVLLFEVTHPEVKYPFNLRIPSSDMFTYEQVFLNTEYDFLAQTPPSVIVDAGANIGLASIYFANRFPDARIIAIEAEASNFSLLERNVAPYPNVTPVHAALWDRPGEITLYDPGLGKWGFMAHDSDSGGEPVGKACHQVATKTVDNLLDEFNLSRIDILKIDIEGAEKEVFTDTSRWIDRVGSLIVELHEQRKPGSRDVFYSGAIGFDHEWRRGENIYLAKGTTIAPSPEPS
jgi:FkbM family methyltransferase